MKNNLNFNFNTVNMLPPFKNMIATIGELPTSFVESMSYYECLCYFYKYLSETILPAINDDKQAIIQVQNAMIELKNYVDNYFNSLDFEGEVDKKLDQMAEDGTLSTIINQQVFGDINTKINNIVENIGTLANLDTTAKNNLVSAINEVLSKMGSLATLNTTDKSSLVNAINEVNLTLNNKIGELSNLDTVTKSSIISAINETFNNIGDISTLNTPSHNNIVTAINELVRKIGSLANLNTTDKSSLVNAINEVNQKKKFISITQSFTLAPNTNDVLTIKFKEDGSNIVDDITKLHFISCEIIKQQSSGAYIYIHPAYSDNDPGVVDISHVIIYESRVGVSVRNSGGSQTNTFICRVNCYIDED